MNIQGTARLTSVASSAASVSPTSAATGATASVTVAATTAASAKASEASGGKTKPAGEPPSGGSSTASKGLVQTANGEYTASSVAADEKDAMALGLTLQKDGNYAAGAAKTIEPSKQASATSTAAVQAALNTLILGG